jgi:hypothetical protein
VRAVCILAAVLLIACGGKSTDANGSSDGGSGDSRAGGSSRDVASSGDSDSDGASDGGVSDSQPYVMACALEPFVGSPVIFYAVTARLDPSATGDGGTLDFSETALVAGATSTSETTGVTTTVVGTVVTGGMATVQLGATNVPPAASPEGRMFAFADTTLQVLLDGERLVCANLGGELIESTDVTLEPAQNICVFFPSTGPVPTLTQAEVHCP